MPVVAVVAGALPSKADASAAQVSAYNVAVDGYIARQAAAVERQAAEVAAYSAAVEQYAELARAALAGMNTLAVTAA